MRFKREYGFAIAALVVGVLATLACVAVMNDFPGFAASAPAPFHAETIAATYNTVTVQSLLKTGTTFTTQAADAQGDKCLNDGRLMLYFTNATTPSVTCTIVTPLTVGGLAVADLVLTIPNTATLIAGPFNPLWFDELSGADKGWMSWSYSSPTNIVVAAVSWTP